MLDQMRSAGQMVKMFKDDASLMARLKTDANPLPVLEEAAKKAEELSWHGDILLFRVAVIVLGALALIAAIGSIGLVASGTTTPEVLVSLGSAAVGALVGLFAPSPSGK
jgi:hypothetical protein